jgi:membrane protein involved in colicin uptake
MAKPLRSQLNQIRAWVRQGRTDAWIAHQLEVSTNELREFRRQHELDVDDEDAAEVDLRDEIEAEIEAATLEEEEAAAEAEAAEAKAAEAEEAVAAESAEEAEPEAEKEDGSTDEGAGEQGDGAPRRRRRRRRGGRGRSGRVGAGMQATFDHGDDEGYGLWLDPAVKDDPVYSEHWAGKRRVEVTIEPDRIVIKRSDSDSD